MAIQMPRVYTSCDAGSYRSIRVHFSSLRTMSQKILKQAATNKIGYLSATNVVHRC